MLSSSVVSPETVKTWMRGVQAVSVSFLLSWDGVVGNRGYRESVVRSEVRAAVVVLLRLEKERGVVAAVAICFY